MDNQVEKLVFDDDAINDALERLIPNYKQLSTPQRQHALSCLKDKISDIERGLAGEQVNIPKANTIEIEQTATRSRAQRILCPVILHRWFEGGEGWAYYPSVKDKVIAYIKAIERHMKPPKIGTIFTEQIEDKFLIGEITDDPAYVGLTGHHPKVLSGAEIRALKLNKGAIGRNPYLCRFVVVDVAIANSETEQQGILAQLRQTLIPQQEGKSEDLKIEI